LHRRNWLLPWLKAGRALRNFFNRIGLTTKLSLMMLFLLLLSLAASYVLNGRSEKVFLEKVEDNINDLSTAIQISVDELTSSEPTREGRLADYVQRLKNKGVKEISILSNEQEVIASSNPKRVGSKINPKRKDLFITARFGEEPASTGSDPQKEYNLLVPIIVENEQQGYAHIVLHMDDYNSFLKSNHLKRLFITILIFTIGIGVSLFLSMKYTEPLYEVVSAAKKIASGDLSRTLPERRGDEIGDLIKSFNEMIIRLRNEKELETRLRRAEQLSTIGQMASGIAHEIRNPLNFISLGIDHLAAQISGWERGGAAETQDLTELTSQMKREIFRLNQMIENFLKYGKPLRLAPCEVDFPALVAEAVHLTRHRASDQGVRVSVRIEKGLERVWIDPEQMKSCLMNVMINAIEAMPDGGRLDIVCRADEEGSRVLLSFTDTGCGIGPEEIKKIFQPYFTTKQLGIGLGLALTKRIVEEHGGGIEAKSRVGEGTTVEIALPLAVLDAVRAGETVGENA
jgi:signal transduction histidine kinase